MKGSKQTNFHDFPPTVFGDKKEKGKRTLLSCVELECLSLFDLKLLNLLKQKKVTEKLCLLDVSGFSVIEGLHSSFWALKR